MCLNHHSAPHEAGCQEPFQSTGRGTFFVPDAPSPSSIGTAVMQSSMRSVLSFLDAPQLNAPEVYIHFKPEVFGEGGEMRDESTAKFLQHYMEENSAFVQRALAANAPGHIGDPEPDPDRLSL